MSECWLRESNPTHTRAPAQLTYNIYPGTQLSFIYSWNSCDYATYDAYELYNLYNQETYAKTRMIRRQNKTKQTQKNKLNKD